MTAKTPPLLRKITVCLAAVMACATTVNMPARAEPVGGTGVEALLWPAIVVVAPFHYVHGLIFGSDDRSAKQADEQTRALLAEAPATFEVDGLYIGGLVLSQELEDLLGDRRIAFIEIDIAGSKWLFEELANPAPLLAQVTHDKPYIRLALADSGQAGCARPRELSRLAHFLASTKVRPGSCITVTLDSQRLSDHRLLVDASRVTKRELRWVLKRTSDGQLQIALPFWQSQTEGQPLQVSTRRIAFTGLVERLQPRQLARSADGQPLVLKTGPRVMAYSRPAPITVPATLEPLAGPAPARWPRTDWTLIYQQGMATGWPQVVDSHLFLPATEEVREVTLGERRIVAGGRLLLALSSLRAWELDGLDLVTQAQWSLNLRVAFSPELRSHCGLTQVPIERAWLQTLESASYDAQGLTLDGLMSGPYPSICKMRLRIAWPQSTADASARVP